MSGLTFLVYVMFQSDGSQYDTLIEQLPAYAHLDLGILVNDNTGYASPKQSLGKLSKVSNSP